MSQGLDNMSGYYSNSNEAQQRQIYNSTSSFLFAADLPDDTCEEDLDGFFTGYKMISSKVFLI